MATDASGKGNVTEAGHLLVADEADPGAKRKLRRVPYALLIQFDGPEDVRAALAAGRCAFTVFGHEAEAKGE